MTLRVLQKEMNLFDQFSYYKLLKKDSISQSMLFETTVLNDRVWWYNWEKMCINQRRKRKQIHAEESRNKRYATHAAHGNSKRYYVTRPHRHNSDTACL
jgi:hypothetical protein